MFNSASFHRLSAKVLLGAACICLFGQAQAQPAQPPVIDLKFTPPEMAPRQICAVREPEPVTISRWRAWDRTALPSDMSHTLIKRDIRRLQQIDAVAWRDTIELVIDRLADEDPGFAGVNALAARIAAMEAAGDFAGLRDQRLVAQLDAQSDTLSPRLKNILSRLMRDGIGIDKDIARADALLVEAGYAGNADALLRLSRMTLDGEAPEGWDVAPDLAVTMAFGSLVGELNETICDRTARIAREYNNGDIVARDVQLAHDWFRFTADLGDTNAAWKVVEYHLQAEDFEKDNGQLLHYLQQAADAGLPYAQIELGRLYETGALVEQDLDRTLALFEAAAASGQRAGLTRFSLFLEAYADAYPGRDQDRLNAMQALAELDDAPGWVFTRLAQAHIAEHGRWAGTDASRSLLERAAALGDTEGITMLAEFLLAERDPRSFDRAVDLLSRTVSTYGGITPTKNLYGAFMCQAGDSPRVAEATYWQQQEAATASANLDLSARELLALNHRDDPLQIAVLQAQALYGRPTSLASYLKFLEGSEMATPEMRAFWNEYSGRFPDVLTALAKLEFELAQSPQQRQSALALLRQEYQRSGAQSALDLAQAILDYDSDITGSLDQVRSLLATSAETGQGAAIRLLASLDPDDLTGASTYDAFADVIAARGDFDALVFAVPHLDDGERERYLARAISVIPCDYKNVMQMVELFQSIDQPEQMAQWLEIASNLTGGNAWAMVDLADKYLELGGPETTTAAEALYSEALLRGDASAARSLFAMLVDDRSEVYDTERAATMLKAAVETEKFEVLTAYLSRYRRASPETRQALAAVVDMPAAHRLAAESGDVFAMRTYAMYLRETAQTAGDLTASTDWLSQAAAGGDTTAMAEFGYALAFGIGTAPDPDEAVAWLQRAAANGSQKAQAITALLNMQDGT